MDIAGEPSHAHGIVLQTPSTKMSDDFIDVLVISARCTVTPEALLP